jgi:Ankyrin repeats (3 copies)/Ankyrin repeats (many copies)
MRILVPLAAVSPSLSPKVQERCTPQDGRGLYSAKNGERFLGRLSHFSALRTFAATSVMLVSLGWNSVAFCGEIHEAVQKGEFAKVQILLKNNPDVVLSKEDQFGWTPLHCAAAGGHKDIAELLLANKADVNAKANDGATPLHLAAMHGNTDVVTLLLNNAADVNARAKGGSTPLHMAAGTGQKSSVELLLAHRADVNVKDDAGRTPLNWATHFGYNDVAEILSQQGGQNTTIDATVKEADRWAYALDYGGGQGMYLTPSAIQMTDSGDWEAAKNTGGITIDFGASFTGKRYMFNGEMKEFVCRVNLRKDGPDARTRIITAAHRDYESGSTGDLSCTFKGRGRRDQFNGLRSRANREIRLGKYAGDPNRRGWWEAPLHSALRRHILDGRGRPRLAVVPRRSRRS